MSSSIICQNFVQNTWKKELCSNCFKSKDEHMKKLNGTNTTTPTTTATIAPSPPAPSTMTFIKSNNIKNRNSILTSITSSLTISSTKANIKSNTRSIIKTTNTAFGRKHKRTVNFKTNLTQVIGYGGEDWSEEEEDVIAYEESSEPEAPGEDELAMVRLTKLNTDYNANLSGVKLQLGKPLVDADGRKQTLLVQVTPFGQDATGPGSNVKAKCNQFQMAQQNTSSNEVKSKTNNKPIEERMSENEKFKEVTEVVTAVGNEVKTSGMGFKLETDKDVEKSLLDEITETLEKSRNPIIKKIVQKEIVLSTPSSKLTRTPVIKEKKQYQTSKCLNLTSPVKEKREADEDKDSSSLDDSSSHCGSEDSNSESSLEASNKTTSYENVIPSRELVGEPDGRAESDNSTDEPTLPALPATPPPPMPTVEKCKPKIPTKPSTITIRKPICSVIPPAAVNQVVLSTFNKSPAPSQPLQKHDSNGSDIAKKRKAPKPPIEEEVLLVNTAQNSIYTRKPAANTDCPVVREKEKRERASSCTPKPIPEPAPRRSLSVSTDSLVSAVGSEGDKKKKVKFSLKKLLRMGGGSSAAKCEQEDKPLPKPRLVIVHPLDLKRELKASEEQEYVNRSVIQEQIKQIQSRPPPPPRNYENYDKPDRLPPKTPAIKQLMQSTTTGTGGTTVVDGKKPLLAETVYANIGEVRNAITPHKPQRTASMREIKDTPIIHRNYEPVGSPPPPLAPKEGRKYKNTATEEHVYDYIGGQRSSSPECDKPTVVPSPGTGSGMSRSVSLTYCGSETESEIYAPYSYYGSESEVAEEETTDCCYGNGLGSTGRTHKLRSKKGRSIVHKNLEDNYGAVVVANHEALAQVLENIQQTFHIPPAMRPLKTTENLCWRDFQLPTTSSPTPPPSPPLVSQHTITIGNCSFQQAAWNNQHVTLMITVVPNSPSCSLGTFTLQAVTEFSDLVPTTVLPPTQHRLGDAPIQATISVLPSLHIHSLASIGEQLNSSKDLAEARKASSVILLQLVNGLKALQAQGIEELPLSLDSFVLAREMEKAEAHARLYILQPNDEPTRTGAGGTLCRIVSKALDLLPVDGQLVRLLQSLLACERAVTLSQVKAVLEFSLWGPADVTLGSAAAEREFVLQRWLDLQRATVLHGLVCTKVQLTVYEECHLLFLVRSNAKTMCDASLLIETPQLT